MQELVDLLKAISDMTRLKIFKLILEQEFSVCELARLLSISQPAVSQHLRRLKAVGLAEEERRGQWIYYKGCQKELVSLTKQLASFFADPIDSIEGFSDIVTLLANRASLDAECTNQKEL